MRFHPCLHRPPESYRPVTSAPTLYYKHKPYSHQATPDRQTTHRRHRTNTNLPLRPDHNLFQEDVPCKWVGRSRPPRPLHAHRLLRLLLPLLDRCPRRPRLPRAQATVHYSLHLVTRGNGKAASLSWTLQGWPRQSRPDARTAGGSRWQPPLPNRSVRRTSTDSCNFFRETLRDLAKRGEFQPSRRNFCEFKELHSSRNSS